MKDLIIAARPAEGFRRCGVFHPPTEVHHRAGSFTEEQVAALKKEPNLIVVEVEPVIEPEDDQKEGRQPKAKGGRGTPKADDAQPPAEAPPKAEDPPAA